MAIEWNISSMICSLTFYVLSMYLFGCPIQAMLKKVSITSKIK